MKGLIHFCLVSIIICISHLDAVGQGASGVKKDGRFTANVSGVAPPIVDKVGLMKGFDLRLQWWTLLGEPMEYYHFRWYTSNEFKIDGKWLKRSDLEKYPDLLKRFDNIRPIKVNLEIEGSFDGFVQGPESYKSGAWDDPNTDLVKPFYLNLDSEGSYGNNSDFRYIINDIRLMRAKSGVWGKAITPISPLNWEHFLQYSIFTSGIKSLNDTKGLTEQELELRRDQMKALLRESTHIIELYAEAVVVEWPMSELRAIAEKFEKYESGEEEPSPVEEVEERLEDESVASLEEYEGDDFWGEPERVSEPVLVIYEENGKKGVKDKKSGLVYFTPSRFQNIEEVINNKYIIVDDGPAPSLPICTGKEPPLVRSKRKYKVVTVNGNEVIDGFFHSYQLGNNRISIERYSCIGEESSESSPKGGGLVISYARTANEGEKIVYDLEFEILNRNALN